MISLKYNKTKYNSNKNKTTSHVSLHKFNSHIQKYVLRAFVLFHCYVCVVCFKLAKHSVFTVNIKPTFSTIKIKTANFPPQLT